MNGLKSSFPFGCSSCSAWPCAPLLTWSSPRDPERSQQTKSPRPWLLLEWDASHPTCPFSLLALLSLSPPSPFPSWASSPSSCLAPCSSSASGLWMTCPLKASLPSLPGLEELVRHDASPSTPSARPRLNPLLWKPPLGSDTTRVLCWCPSPTCPSVRGGSGPLSLLVRTARDTNEPRNLRSGWLCGLAGWLPKSFPKAVATCRTGHVPFPAWSIVHKPSLAPRSRWHGSTRWLVLLSDVPTAHLSGDTPALPTRRWILLSSSVWYSVSSWPEVEPQPWQLASARALLALSLLAALLVRGSDGPPPIPTPFSLLDSFALTLSCGLWTDLSSSLHLPLFEAIV